MRVCKALPHIPIRTRALRARDSRKLRRAAYAKRSTRPSKQQASTTKPLSSRTRAQPVVESAVAVVGAAGAAMPFSPHRGEKEMDWGLAGYVTLRWLGGWSRLPSLLRERNASRLPPLPQRWLGGWSRLPSLLQERKASRLPLLPQLWLPGWVATSVAPTRAEGIAGPAAPTRVGRRDWDQVRPGARVTAPAAG